MSVLLERDDELGTIERLLVGARGRHGGVVAIVGPAGIGKSSLLRAAGERAEAQGLRTLRARGSELESAFPFGLARQLFEPQLVRRDPDRVAAAFAGTARHAAPLLGIELPARPPASKVTGQTALLGLYWLLDNLASEQPLLVVVDDAHWSDRGSADWLAFAARRLESTPAALLVALRPGTAGDHLQPLLDDAATDILQPSPLGLEAATELVARELRPSVDPGFARSCQEATGGNPFLLRELARALADQGIAPDRSQAERVALVTSERLERFVAARMAQLSGEAETLAHAVAVLGDGVELHDAAAIARLPLERAARAGDGLRDAGLLGPSDRLSFVHPLVASAVHAAIPPGRLAMDHAHAARVLDGRGVELVAAQLLHCAASGDEWAADRLMQAAGDALDRGAPGEAVTLLRRAEREGVPGRRPAILAALGHAELRVGDWAAVEHLRVALEHAGAPGQRATIASALTQALLLSGRFDAAFETLTEQIAILREPEPELALRLQAWLCATARIDAGWAERAIAVLRSFPVELKGRTPGERGMLACLAAETAAAGADLPLAVALAERALAGGALLAETGGEPPVYSLACVALIWCEEYTLALRHIGAAYDEAHAAGSPIAVAHACAWRALAHLEQGQLGRAEADALAAVTIAEQHLEIMPAPLALAWLIRAQLAQGRIKDAESALAGSILTAELPALVHMTPLLHARGQLRHARRDLDGALADLEAAGRILTACGMPGAVPEAWRSGAVHVLRDLDREEQALELAGEELRWARGFAAPGALGRALRAFAAAGPRDEAVDVLREGVAVLETSGSRLEHARTLCELGAALRRQGLRREARDPLRSALELATDCGAGPVVARVRDELRASGARPRRIRLSGRDALTPAELRVAELATEGLTNREIAQGLFVTVKTVETQLGHAYAKLGIGSRRELPGALAAERTAPAGAPTLR